MTFTPREGMICVTRDGRKMGPIMAGGSKKGWFYTDRLGLYAFHPDGTHCRPAHNCVMDLVAEWVDPDCAEPVTDEPALPVRTRTVTEIIPGTYGKVVVKDSEVAFVILSFLSQYGEQSPWSFTWTADETRAAAKVLNHIADAMGEKP